MPLERDQDIEDLLPEDHIEWTRHRSVSFAPQRQDVVEQGKCLCGQYIRARLRRAGVLNKKVTQRLRVILDTPSSLYIRDVFPALNTLGEELERMHPRLYINVSRQLSPAPFGELKEADTAPLLLHTVTKELFKCDITWGKVISFFALAGGLAVDCVRQGHYDYVQCLIEGSADIIEEELLVWLTENGGWSSLLEHIRPTRSQVSFLGWLSMLTLVLIGIYLIFHLLQLIGSTVFATFW